MLIFTTREIAVFIYVIFFTIFFLVNKKTRTSVFSVNKSVYNINLVVPLLIVLLYAALFVWTCTYLPFWDWIYIKDIVFWVLFAGVPVCFNAVEEKLEKHYFRNIIIENLKFAALVEFITSTFTFHIAIELILQPILVIFIILQSMADKKSLLLKKNIDWIFGVVGFVILAFTAKIAIDSIGNIQFVDILVGLVLPIILSVLYLPIAYFFAVYAKYEILFMRMGFKEPKDKKLKIKHRVAVIKLCKLSYKKICRFLNTYLPRMYIKMSDYEFEALIDEFRDTVKHTYIAIINYNGKYYVGRNFLNDEFSFNTYAISKGGLFQSSNKTLRKEISLQIQKETPFKNSKNYNDRTYYSVSLRKIFLFMKGAFFKRTKVAIFYSDTFEKSNDSIYLPFGECVKDQCNKKTKKIMKALKWNMLGAPFIAVLVYFIIFVLSAFISVGLTVNLDIAAFLFTIINQVSAIFSNIPILTNMKIKQKIIRWKNNFMGGYIILEIILVFVSLFIAKAMQPINISSLVLSKLGIALIFSSILIDILKRDQ